MVFYQSNWWSDFTLLTNQCGYSNSPLIITVVSIFPLCIFPVLWGKVITTRHLADNYYILEMSKNIQEPPAPPSLATVLLDTVRGILWGSSSGSGSRRSKESSLTREDVNYLLDMDGVGLCFHELYKSKQAFKKQ